MTIDVLLTMKLPISMRSSQGEKEGRTSWDTGDITFTGCSAIQVSLHFLFFLASPSIPSFS